MRQFQVNYDYLNTFSGFKGVVARTKTHEKLFKYRLGHQASSSFLLQGCYANESCVNVVFQVFLLSSGCMCICSHSIKGAEADTSILLIYGCFQKN